MDELNTAANVVTAVFESAGYYTQADMLEKFAPFFRSGGALLFTMALIGASASVAIFGSFRMARYLLVGPGLLYFLVFTRTTVSPVIWQIGDEDRPEAEQDITRFFTGPIAYSAFSADDPVNVSWFFAWYAHLASELTRSMSAVILDDEIRQDFLFVNKEQVYRMVTSSTVTDKNTDELVQSAILGECQNSTATLIALSDTRFSSETISRFFTGGYWSDQDWWWGPLTAVLLILERYDLIARLTVEKEHVVNPGEPMRQFIKNRIAEMDSYDDGSGYLDIETIFGSSVDYDELNAQIEEGSLTMTCEKAWLVSYDALRYHAAERERKIYQQVIYNWARTYPTDGLAQAAYFLEQIPDEALPHPYRLWMCEAVARKLYGGDINSLIMTPEAFTAFLEEIDDGGCSLIDAISLYMLKNTLSKEPTFSQSASQNSSRSFSTLYRPDSAESVSGVKQALPWSGNTSWINNQNSGSSSSSYSTASPNVTNQACQAGSACTDNLSVTSQQLGSVASIRDDKFNEQLEYLARSLMQQIFNYSFQIPYWQGVLLYLLAIAYPFFAVIVVLPNRASAFFYLPLAWLWVKSWDVGFALVRVFDEVVWQILQGQGLSYDDMADEFWDTIDASINGMNADFFIPSVLRKLFYDNPAADLYQHYFYVSIALFSVPAVTGMIILRGRQIALASFTDAAESFAANETSYQSALNKMLESDKSGSGTQNTSSSTSSNSLASSALNNGQNSSDLSRTSGQTSNTSLAASQSQRSSNLSTRQTDRLATTSRYRSSLPMSHWQRLGPLSRTSAFRFGNSPFGRGQGRYLRDRQLEQYDPLETRLFDDEENMMDEDELREMEENHQRERPTKARPIKNNPTQGWTEKV